MKLFGRRGRSRHDSAGLGPDQRSLARLESSGAKLSRPRHVIHELSFDDEHGALLAAEAAEAAGWETSVSAPDADGERWSVRAEGTRVVDSTTVGAFRSWFERVATEGRGTYDGWEAAAKP